MKVLVVEDDARLSGIISQHLKSESIGSFLATSGEDALSITKSTTPDLILLDLMLSGDINGLDVLKELKEDMNTSKIPVVVLSNLDSEEKLAKQLGAVDYMVKANMSLGDIVERVKLNLRNVN